MKEATYTIGPIPFEKWIERYKAVEHLVITGVVDMQTFETIAKAFDYTLFKRITLDGVKTKEESDNDSSDERHSYENEIIAHLYSMDESILYPLTKMYLNSDYGNGEFIVLDNDILSADKKTLIHTPEEKTLTIRDGIERIGKFACSDYGETTHLTLCEGLKEIGDYAFAYSCVEEVYMPNSLTTLGSEAFRSTDIEKVKFSENLSNVPDGCFAYTFLEQIELPNSVKSIGNEAFARTRIDCIFLPEGVETIDWNAFDFLMQIYLPSTLKYIASDFYYEAGIDSENYPPYVRIHPDNPVFYAKDGTLYLRENDKCALDSVYNQRKEW